MSLPEGDEVVPGAEQTTSRSIRPRRVLFLDFDGVLHPAAEPGSLGPSPAYMRVGPFGWLPQLVQLLAPHPDVEVVVHSSWRETYSLAEIRDMLADFGERSVDVTPAGPRLQSIRSWLALQAGVLFVILDDDALEFPDPQPIELILCSPGRGVCDEVVVGRLQLWLTETDPGSPNQALAANDVDI